MKKTLFSILATVSLLFAESYQVNTLSAKQLGMAHTGAGITTLGSEGMHFNPGAIGFIKTLDISLGATFIIPEVEYWGKEGNAKNTELGTPIYFYAAYGITDWLTAGLSFTTPYGNAVDYGKEWVGADLLQNISLAVYAIQPTVAFKPIDGLSIGAGPAIYFGSFEQSKALVPNPLDGGATTAASATFSGDADVAVAVNAGIQYEILPDKLALGVGYRSEAKAKVSEGKVEVNYANEIPDPVKAGIAAQLPTFEEGNFKAELPLPANLNAGISFRPIDKLLLAFDWQIIFWGTYKELSIDFTDEVTVAVPGMGDIPFNKTPPGSAPSIKKYHNAFAYRLGAQYSVLEQLDARLGVYFDETPVDDDYLTPESPSTDKLGSTIGFSFRPMPNLSIDASFLYALGFGRDATSGSNDKKDDGKDGRYEVQAWVPSIGVSYNF